MSAIIDFMNINYLLDIRTEIQTSSVEWAQDISYLPVIRTKIRTDKN
jgi:hypothetical protein